jgi:NTP pyrophosphatase (non-canonical NTP hydrolase)
MKIRPCVQEFAEAMERKLRTNDGERGNRGWSGYSPEWLTGRLVDEVEELELAVRNESSEAAAREAIDVANFAMMIHDVLTRKA